MKFKRKVSSLFLVLLFLTLYFHVSLEIAPLVYGNPVYEDFTTYTEVDDDSKLTVTSTRITWSNYERDDNGYVYKSHSGITDFEHWFDLNLSAVEAGDTDDRNLASVWLLDVDSAVKGDDFVCVRIREDGANDNQYIVKLMQKDGGTFIVDLASAVITTLDPVYFRVNRTGTTLTLDGYSTTALRDAGGDGDVCHLTSSSAVTDTYNYIFMAVSANSLTDGSDYSSGYVENLDLNEGDTENPQYSNPTYSTDIGGQSCTFNVTWTDNVNMSGYIFGWNGTGTWQNDTWQAWSPTQTPAYSAVTKTLPANGSVWIVWRVWANDTSDNWNSTGNLTFWCWKPLPNVSEFNLGQSQGGTFWQGPVYYNGCIFVAYANSSFYPDWKYQVRAFNINTSSWTPAYTVGTAGGSDSHWNPTLSVLPDGRLIVFYGYYSKMKFRISTYSANNTDLTTLLSNWEAEQRLKGAYLTSGPDAFKTSYPLPIRFNDTVVVFVRDGTASYGSAVSYFKWKDDLAVTLFVNANTSDYTDWTAVGSQPYLDNSTSNYISNSGSGLKRMGYFTFPDLDENYYFDTLQVNLSIYCDYSGGTGVDVYLYDGSSWNLAGTLSVQGGGAQWQTFNVTNILDNQTKVDSAKIYFEVDGAGESCTIYKAKLVASGEGFDSCTIIAQPDSSYPTDTQPYYPCPTKQDGKILLTWSILQDASKTNSTYHDVCFIYTSDKGETWRFVNGTSFTLPTTFNQTRVHESPDKTASWGAIITTENRLAIGYKYNKVPYLLYYNTTVGNTGTWENNTIKYANGTVIGEVAFNSFMDTYYGRVSFWASPNESNSTRFLKKFVRVPNELYKFKVVWQDTTYNYTKMDERMYAGIIQDSPEAYELVTKEEYWDVLGNTTSQNSQLSMTAYYLYGFKFTAQTTCNLTSVRFFVNATTANIYWDAAVYNSSFNQLGNTTEGKVVSANPAVRWSWSTSFSSPPRIVEGESYWIVFRVKGSGQYLFYTEDNSAYVNMSLIKTQGSGDPFPQTLSSFTYYNRTCRVVAFPTFLIVRGLGVDEYATSFSSMGTNTTVAGTPCLFHAYVQDGTGLSHAKFYWNASGTMQENGTISLSGTEDWANFTRTLPNQYILIGWLVWVNDTSGNPTNSSVQTLQVVRVVSETFTENVQVSTSMNCYREKQFLQTETVTVTSQITSQREKLFYTSETVKVSDTAYKLGETMLSFTETVNVTSVFQYIGREVLFTLTETVKPNTTLNKWTEQLMTFTETVNILTQTNFLKELLFVETEIVNTEQANISATLLFWRELLFQTSETVKPSASFNVWRELLFVQNEFVGEADGIVKKIALMFTNTETLGIETVFTSLTETMFVTFEVLESVTISATQYLTMQLTVAVSYATEDYVIAMMLMGIAVSLTLIIAFHRIRRTEEENEEDYYP